MKWLRRLLRWAPGTDGRLVLAATMALYLLVIAAGRLVWHVDVWPSLGVPSGPSVFYDARNLTAALECDRLGYDPLYENPCDPRRRPLMYLRPWLLLGAIGLDQSHTAGFAVVLIVLMFVTFSALVGRVPAGSGVVLACATCSPAIMFAVERANMDIALFSIVAGAIVLWRAIPGAARVVSPLLVLVAASGKLYPVFALPAFILTRSRMAARVAILCLVAFALYCLLNLRDIAHVAAIATQGELFSYGARILPAHLYHQFGADRWAGPPVVKQMMAASLLGGVAVVMAIWARRRLPATGDIDIAPTASIVALHAGAFVYLGTFAVVNSFDYRLVFVLLTLPQLIDWARSAEPRLSSLATLALAMILLLLWVGSLSRWLSLWDELASWAVAGLLAALVVETLPTLKSLGHAIAGDRRVAGSTV